MLNFVLQTTGLSEYRITAYFKYEYDFQLTPYMIKQIINETFANGWNPGKSELKNFGVNANRGKGKWKLLESHATVQL